MSCWWCINPTQAREDRICIQNPRIKARFKTSRPNSFRGLLVVRQAIRPVRANASFLNDSFDSCICARHAQPCVRGWLWAWAPRRWHNVANSVSNTDRVIEFHDKLMSYDLYIYIFSEVSVSWGDIPTGGEWVETTAIACVATSYLESVAKVERLTSYWCSSIRITGTERGADIMLNWIYAHNDKIKDYCSQNFLTTSIKIGPFHRYQERSIYQHTA